MADDRDIVDLFERRFTTLTEHLDQRFDSVDQRFDGVDQRFDGVDQRFDGIDGRLDSMDQRFDDVDGRLDSMDQRFDGVDGRLDSMDQRFEGLEGEVRHVRVEIEALRDADRQLADGIASVNQKLDGFMVDVSNRFTETQSMIRLSHRQVEERIKNLEGRYDELDARLTALESGRH